MDLMSWILLLGTALTLFWILGAYNRLMRLRQSAAEAFKPIAELTTFRLGLLPELLRMARGHLGETHSLLEPLALTHAHGRSALQLVQSQPQDAGALLGFMQALSEVDRTLDDFARDLPHYPELQLDPALTDALHQLANSQPALDFACVTHDKQLALYNHACAEWPTQAVVRMFRFNPLPRWSLDEGHSVSWAATDMPPMV